MNTLFFQEDSPPPKKRKTTLDDYFGARKTTDKTKHKGDNKANDERKVKTDSEKAAKKDTKPQKLHERNDPFYNSLYLNKCSHLYGHGFPFYHYVILKGKIFISPVVDVFQMFLCMLF